jgi:DNA polymerase-3 subunit epsilon
MTWADGPLLAFDLETTGADPESARIVQAALCYIVPGKKVIERVLLADPGVEIPADATAVHGISTEQARAKGAPLHEVVEEIAATIRISWREGHPLIAYNAVYDLTVLDREIARIGGLPLAVGPVVDPFVIDKKHDRYRKGSRKLIDTCAHYGITLSEEDAHGAAADAMAAARLAWKLSRAYPVVGDLGLQELHTLQIAWAKSQASGLAAYFERQGNADAAADCRRRMWPLTPAYVPSDEGSEGVLF